MRKTSRDVLAFVLASLTIWAVPTAVTAAPVPPAEAAEPVPGIAPPDSDTTAVYLDAEGRPVQTAERTGAQRLGCTPVSGRDNPHRSGTGVAVSGHGWWDKGTCDNDRADVYNCIVDGEIDTAEQPMNQAAVNCRVR
ncbi:hypothetical protein PV682_15305 [Streptomyces niveiscabiei]|uniref:hypothetical protein n=1 Tax=Streptomyces niveiscabiei TaxID=164115 RepID=UPI0029AC5A52|nr:hypothetical protein [Streptomyces niveiscabiei]MDX3382826.1 hypothetical protein [Streptomyces niveiscabiei]